MKDIEKLLKNGLKTSFAPNSELNNKLKGKMYMKNETKKKNAFTSGFFKTAYAVLGICAVFTGAVNLSPAFAKSMENIPVLGTLTRVVTFRTYDDSEQNFKAHVEIPEIENLGGLTEEINKQISDYAEEIIKTYEDDKEASNGLGHYNLTSNYTVLTNNDRYFSIKIQTEISMASTNAFNKFFTIDKKSEKLVTLDDLYASDPDYKKKLYDNIVNQMQEQMKNDDSVMYFLGDDEFGFSFKEITGKENFYINDADEVIISFDKYEVAPGAMGICEFNVGKF